MYIYKYVHMHICTLYVHICTYTYTYIHRVVGTMFVDRDMGTCVKENNKQGYGNWCKSL